MAISGIKHPGAETRISVAKRKAPQVCEITPVHIATAEKLRAVLGLKRESVASPLATLGETRRLDELFCSGMQSEEARDEKNDDHDADDVENIHCALRLRHCVF
jgi:hypothetical protein